MSSCNRSCNQPVTADHPSLFGDLPVLTVPLYLYADRHVLEPCRRCNGAGARLVYVGDVRDV